MNPNLVSVICLCHNHVSFVKKAIQSVWDQDYGHVELIVVDDASTDGSKEVIEEGLKGTETIFISLLENLGNCKAFNLGFAKSNGAYIIDLAADDLLLPTRISEGLKTFKKKDIGVEFCNVENISPTGVHVSNHFAEGQLVPQGDLYITLIEKYLISPPGMIVKRGVLDELNGYDESLTYEDFDFWIRSSRNWDFGYTDQVLVKKRTVNDSHSSNQFKWRSPHQRSTLMVCQKIKELNKSEKEHQALQKRCWYEIRQCIRQGNLELIPAFVRLL